MGTILKRRAVCTLGALASSALVFDTACGRTTFWPEPAREDAGGVAAGGAGGEGGTGPGIVATNKLDVLLMVDNSHFMGDKQAVFATALSDLVDGLSALEDLHVGVVTSSLGGHGAATCEKTEDENDHGELLGSRTRAAELGLSEGFVEWHRADGTADLAKQMEALVMAAGQAGCGLEAQLEAVYRFLVDPTPPEDIALVRCPGVGKCAAPAGVDELILKQRAAFLRPDSAVAIVFLSDENDCSIRDSDQYYFGAAVDLYLPRSAGVCDASPNDSCCYSCGLLPPDGCEPDPSCGPTPPSYDDKTDPPNLRCFNQKRRFGIDFLYPIARYVNAFKSRKLCTTRVDLDASGSCPNRPDRSSGVVVNPLYEKGSAGRDPSMVHLMGIVGVPWQDIAVDPSGPELQYHTPSEALFGTKIWDAILGEPNPAGAPAPVPPSDAHMQEAIDQRPGLPDWNASYMADPIHGHEWNISSRDNLQFACIFERPVVGTCGSPDDCDCYYLNAGDNNPLCENADGKYERKQYFGAAYPGLRELSVIRGMGDSGLVASICPRNLSDESAQDYGYRPAIEALTAELAHDIK